MSSKESSHSHSPASVACRLIVDPPAMGAWNMAVDEVLLESAAEAGVCTLRFYRWSEPTLSLGYFQNYEDRLQHRGSRNCAAVRRNTGGGAILHDEEITYSLALPLECTLARDATWLYDSVHDALCDALARWSISSHRHVPPEPSSGRDEPFLCFQRRARGDVLLGGTKICGSAQRRRRGGILQHGSVLLATSPAAKELPGIEELTGIKVSETALVRAWQEELSPRLGLQLEAQTLSPHELTQVRTLVLEKYHGLSWTRRR